MRPLRPAALLSLLPLLAACGGDATPKDPAGGGCAPALLYRDIDEDGVGGGDPVEVCAGARGHVAEGGDCDDLDPATQPGAPERCDGEDNDCDGEIDEDIEPGAEDQPTWYPDEDGDGFGGPEGLRACAGPAGTTDQAGDCDDADPEAYPGAPEQPRDGRDQDCDGEDALTLAVAPFPGSLLVDDLRALEAFCDDYDAIDGDLVVLGGAGERLSLDCLLEIRGDLLLVAPELSAVSLPALWWVEGSVTVRGPEALDAVALDALRIIDGDLRALEADGWRSPRLAALEQLGGDCAFDGALPALTTIGGDLVQAPEAGALREIEGSLIPDAAIAALELPALERLGGELNVSGESALQRLRLPQLRSVGDRLVLRALPELREVALEGLEQTGGALVIEGSAGLEALSFPLLAAVGGELRLEGAGLRELGLEADLLDVEGEVRLSCGGCLELDLGGLRRANGGITLALPVAEALRGPSLEAARGPLALSGPALQEIDLPLLEALQGAELHDLEALASLRLPRLASPGGALSLERLPALVELDLGALRLPTLSDLLSLRDLRALTTLDLPNLAEERGSLRIEALPALESLRLEGLSTLRELTLTVPVRALRLPQLASVDGDLVLDLKRAETLELRSLTEVDGAAELLLDVPIVTFSAPLWERTLGTLNFSSAGLAPLRFPALRSVGGALIASPGPGATVELAALEEVGGALTLQDASALPALALPALREVGGLTLLRAPALGLVDAPALITCAGDLSIEDVGIGSLSGLSALRGRLTGLRLEDNPQLTELSALGSLSGIDGDLLIRGNAALPTAEIDALIDAIGPANISGALTVAGNGP